MILKPRIKTNGPKALKAVWDHNHSTLSVDTILEFKEAGEQLEFDFSYDGKYKNVFHPHKLLMNLIYQFDLRVGTVSWDLIRRILNGGGLINYAKKLEKEINI